jgi:hypothetical protein
MNGIEDTSKTVPSLGTKELGRAIAVTGKMSVGEAE